MRRGTVVLTPFPFTDLSGQKVRPAVIVSRVDRPDTDVILAFITSRIIQPFQESDLLIEDTHADFPETGLKVSSVVRCDKLVTIDTSILIGELGELSDEMQGKLSDCLRHSLDI